MQLPQFDHTKCSWDRYRAFHIPLGASREWYADSAPFVQFDTGELIVRHYYFKPAERRYYPEMNLTVVSTTDAKCPELTTPDGEEIKKSWLTHKGAQQLIIDHDTRRAVYIGRADKSQIPERFKEGCSVYFAGALRTPCDTKVIVHKPKKLTPDERQHVETIRAACKAWAQLAEHEAVIMQPIAMRYNTPLSVGKILQCESFLDLSAAERKMVAYHGTQAQIESASYPYLLTR